MKKLILNIGIFFSEIHKYYYAGGENTIVPTKNKYAIWLFPTQFILYFTIYYILEMVIKLDRVYEWQTFVALYLVVFTITTIPYSILSKINWSWKLYFPYPFVWFMSYATKDEKDSKLDR